MSEKLKVAEVRKRGRWEGVEGKDFEFFKCISSPSAILQGAIIILVKMNNMHTRP